MSDSTIKQKNPVTGVPSVVYLILFSIFFIIIISMLVSSCLSDEENEDLVSPKSSKTIHKTTIVFQDSTLMDSEEVGPGEIWETKINFRFFRIYPSKNNIFVQYTNRNGGWTQKYFVSASGNFSDAPKDVGRGPVKVTLADTSSNAKSSYVKLFKMKK